MKRNVPTEQLSAALTAVVRLLPTAPADGNIEARNYAVTEKELGKGWRRITFRFDFRVPPVAES